MPNPEQEFDRAASVAGRRAEVIDESLAAIEERVRSVRMAGMITAGVGIVHSILLMAAFFLIRDNVPGPEATDQQVMEYVQDPDSRRLVLLAALYLIPFAGIAFLWFTIALRMWLVGSVRALTPLLANILLACGIVYVVLLFSAGAASSVTALVAEFEGDTFDATDYRVFPAYGTSLLLVFAMRMAAMIVFALSTIGRSSGVLPKWFAYLGYLLGIVLLLTASLDPVIVLLFPIWLLILSFLMLRRARGIPDTAAIPANAVTAASIE